MSTQIKGFSQEFPDLPIEILKFFCPSTPGFKAGTTNLLAFLNAYTKAKNMTGSMPLPTITEKICDILSDYGYLNCITRGGALATQNTYSTSASGVQKLNTLPNNNLSDYLSCLAYGFAFTYQLYKSAVLPIRFEKTNGDITIGSCFLLNGKIVTARHCLENSKSIAILGFKKNDFQNAKVYYHQHATLDLAVIELHINTSMKSFRFSEQAEILTPVITIGYPRIPGFHTFETVESAQISARITVTHGSIAATASNYFSQTELLLITAKIRGGNSGGPLVNESGSVVGVATEKPEGNGNYDDLGYGTVIPINYVVDEMFTYKAIKDVTQTINFADFP